MECNKYWITTGWCLARKITKLPQLRRKTIVEQYVKGNAYMAASTSEFLVATNSDLHNWTWFRRIMTSQGLLLLLLHLKEAYFITRIVKLNWKYVDPILSQSFTRQWMPLKLVPNHCWAPSPFDDNLNSMFLVKWASWPLRF